MPKKVKIKKGAKKPRAVVKTQKKIKAAGSQKTRVFQTLRGMKDLLPGEYKYWHFVKNQAENFSNNYGYEFIETPILEETALFNRAVGGETDIVSKEMFSFVDQGGEHICLRPEVTASIARAYIQHGMLNLPQPVKFFYSGPIFRRERPQAGRLRSFHQFGFEALGDGNAVIDAEIIFLTYNLIQSLGLKTNVQINSIGCPKCRESYKNKLVNYYRDRRSSLCEDCKKRLVKNPLRILDCKEGGCEPLKEGAPQIVDYLCDECKNHFVRVLEYLDDAAVPYNLNPYLVRGLDYYTKTVFEFFPEENQSAGQKVEALGAGGRYDNLVETLGGRPTPACGVALGVERLITKIKETNVEVPPLTPPDIFLAQLGEQARKKSFALIEDLRRAGFYITHGLTKEGLKKQLEIANKLGARYALLLGQKEVLDGTIIIRDMDGGSQEIADFVKIVQEMKKKLTNGIAK
ncbi:MAG: histidine--tRNA ligase [Patescibacteria group bacterium]